MGPLRPRLERMGWRPLRRCAVTTAVVRRIVVPIDAPFARVVVTLDAPFVSPRTGPENGIVSRSIVEGDVTGQGGQDGV